MLCVEHNDQQNQCLLLCVSKWHDIHRLLDSLFERHKIEYHKILSLANTLVINRIIETNTVWGEIQSWNNILSNNHSKLKHNAMCRARLTQIELECVYFGVQLQTNQRVMWNIFNIFNWRWCQWRAVVWCSWVIDESDQLLHAQLKLLFTNTIYNKYLTTCFVRHFEWASLCDE